MLVEILVHLVNTLKVNYLAECLVVIGCDWLNCSKSTIRICSWPDISCGRRISHWNGTHWMEEFLRDFHWTDISYGRRISHWSAKMKDFALDGGVGSRFSFKCSLDTTDHCGKSNVKFSAGNGTTSRWTFVL